MENIPVTLHSFLDELEKIAVSAQRMQGSNTRSGRRPMRVDTMLKKEKEGTLYKDTGCKDKIAGSVPFLEGPPDPGRARIGKKRSDVPSRDDVDAIKREDSRGNAATVIGPGNFSVAPDVGGKERSM